MPFILAILEAFLVLSVLVGLLSGTLWVIARKEKWRVVKWLSGLVFAGCGLVVSVWLILYVYWAIRERLPGPAFKAAFGQEPPPGTVLIHGRTSEFVDSAGIGVAFRTDRATFDRLRPLQMKRASLEDYHNFRMRRHPSWWREPDAATEIWIRNFSFDKAPLEKRVELGDEMAVMTWDPDGLAQYEWLEL